MNSNPFKYQLGSVSSGGSDSESDSDNENSDIVSRIATGGISRQIHIPQDKLDVVSEHFF